VKRIRILVGEIAINTPNYLSAVFSEVYRTLITAINTQKACDCMPLTYLYIHFLFLFQEIIRSLNAKISDKEQHLIFIVVQTVVAVVMMPIIIMLVYSITKKLQSFANSLKDKTYALENERERSEQILYQMTGLTVSNLVCTTR
jgi:hypothetical protein